MTDGRSDSGQLMCQWCTHDTPQLNSYERHRKHNTTSTVRHERVPTEINSEMLRTTSDPPHTYDIITYASMHQRARGAVSSPLALDVYTTCNETIEQNNAP